MVALVPPDSQLCLLNSEAISVLWVPLLHCILETLKGGCGATIGLSSLASCLSGISTSFLSPKHLKKYCLSYSVWFLMVSGGRENLAHCYSTLRGCKRLDSGFVKALPWGGGGSPGSTSPHHPHRTPCRTSGTRGYLSVSFEWVL